MEAYHIWIAMNVDTIDDRNALHAITLRHTRESDLLKTGSRVPCGHVDEPI